MRRSVMGTMSVLLMLTAVIVALIPVPKAAALSADQFDVYYDGGAKTGFTATFNMNAYLPDRYTTEAFPVYASGDGMLRVAFGSNYGSEVGVIVGYNKANSLNSSPDGYFEKHLSILEGLFILTGPVLPEEFPLELIVP